MFERFNKFRQMRLFSDELAPGIPKPTATLAHMLASEMLQNLDVSCKLNTDMTSTMEFPSFSCQVYCIRYFENDSWTRDVNLLRLRNFKLRSGINVEFDDNDQKIILSAWMKYISLRKRHQEMLRVEKNQQLAVDAIALLFKKEEVDAPTRSPNHEGR